MVYLDKIWQKEWKKTKINELSTGRGYENTLKHFFTKGFDSGIEYTIRSMIKRQCVICNKSLKDLGEIHYPLCRKHRELFMEELR